MPQTNDPTLFDTRVIHHHLRRGSLTPEQLAEHLAALPDDAEHGEPTVTRFTTRGSAPRSTPAGDAER